MSQPQPSVCTKCGADLIRTQENSPLYPGKVAVFLECPEFRTDNQINHDMHRMGYEDAPEPV